MGKICKKCGKIFERKHNAQKYCEKCVVDILQDKTPKEKLCKECGKLIGKASNAQKFCSYQCQYNYGEKTGGKGHHTKPSGWTFHGECQKCGKQFESDRIRKHCSDECTRQAQLDRWKYIRGDGQKHFCAQCGKELLRNGTKFCCRVCQRRFNKKKHKKTDKVWIPLTDEILCKRIAERFDNIEHVSGHNSDGPVIVRCKTCTGEFEINEQRTRKSTRTHVNCPHCAAVQKAEESKNTTVHSCEICGQIILSNQPRAKYCSAACRKEAATRQYHTKRVGERECRYCGKAFVPELHEAWAFCSEKCKQKQANIEKRKHRHTRRVLKKCNGEIDHSISLEKLARRDKNTCHICGRKCDKHDFRVDAGGNFIAGDNHPSLDHVMPLSKGGTHTWDNVKLAHCKCNRIKSDMQSYEKANGQIVLAV